QVITLAWLAVVDRTAVDRTAVDRTAAWLLPAVNTVAPARARVMPPTIRFPNPITGLSPSVRPPRKLRFPATRFPGKHVTNHHRYARELSCRHTMPFRLS